MSFFDALTIATPFIFHLRRRFDVHGISWMSWQVIGISTAKYVVGGALLLLSVVGLDITPLWAYYTAYIGAHALFDGVTYLVIVLNLKPAKDLAKWVSNEDAQQFRRSKMAHNVETGTLMTHSLKPSKSNTTMMF